MTLPSQTSISLSQIQTEMGGSNPISLSEYYAGGGLTPPETRGFPAAIPGAFGPFPTVAIPTSGTISLANFFAAGNYFNYNITTNTNDLNITDSGMLSAGWDGAQRVKVTISSGITVSATTTTTAALRLSGTFPSGVEIVVSSTGKILGRGGAGGGGASLDGLLFQYVNATAGSAGGAAIAISSYTGPTVIISNSGEIRGGGGGGGGGASRGAGVDAGKGVIYKYVAGGGGGGGGRSSSTNSTGGSGGAATRANAVSPGSAGSAGTSSAAGNGGNGGSYAPYVAGGAGGAGGDYGATGSTGSIGGAGDKYGSEAAGGSGGAAVTGYGSASLTNYGSGAYSGSLVT